MVAFDSGLQLEIFILNIKILFNFEKILKKA